MMLITCYTAIGDKAKARRAARTTLERAERAIARDPTNGPALAVGALALAMSGETERAREWIQRALVLDPDNLTMRYNLACSLLLEIGDAEEALETLEPFFERTNSPTLIRHLEVDPDLDSIRKDKRFIEMVAAAKKRLGITDAAG
jgi:adenylate cyclase